MHKESTRRQLSSWVLATDYIILSEFPNKPEATYFQRFPL